MKKFPLIAMLFMSYAFFGIAYAFILMTGINEEFMGKTDRQIMQDAIINPMICVILIGVGWRMRS